MRLITNSFLFLLVIGTLLVFACSGQQAKPFEYHAADDIAAGPGVFTKDKGELTIYDSNKNKPSDNKPTSQGEHPNGSAASASTASDRQSGAAEIQPADHTDSFRQFKEWQRDQAEFEEFKKWKETQKGSQEYEEFQQWKRWKEYKQWQQDQAGQK